MLFLLSLAERMYKEARSGARYRNHSECETRIISALSDREDKKREAPKESGYGNLLVDMGEAY